MFKLSLTHYNSGRNIVGYIVRHTQRYHTCRNDLQRIATFYDYIYCRLWFIYITIYCMGQVYNILFCPRLEQ